QPDGALWFRRPDGRLLPDVPPPVALPADPVAALRAWHESLGLRLHARTACPRWLGERLDVVWAIDVLHPRARRGGRSHPSSEEASSQRIPSDAPSRSEERRVGKECVCAGMGLACMIAHT